MKDCLVCQGNYAEEGQDTCRICTTVLEGSKRIKPSEDKPINNAEEVKQSYSDM